MANELRTTLVGNLTADPELRFIQSGRAVANFTIAHTDRRWDRDQSKMVDGETVFMRCAAWGQMGENIAESLTKGTRVIAQVVITQRKHEDKTYTEATVEAIGPDLLFTTVKVGERAQHARPQGDGGFSGGAPAGGNDPWSAGPPAGEPPF